MSRKTSFDDHMNMIAGAQKTAAQKPVTNSSTQLLQKLAEELGVGGTVTPVGGQTTDATSTVAEVNPTVAAATDAVINPQVAVAGGVPAVAEAGMAAAPTKPDQAEVISSGDGTAKSINEHGKVPEAAAAAADESVASNYDSAAEAEKTGALIAESFVKNLEKIAKQQEYSSALGTLKEAGLLEGYDIKDAGMVKAASAEVDFLQKIASKQSLSHDDIIGAANQYVNFVKVAEEAEKAGEEDANKLVEALNELSEQNKGEGEGEGEDNVAAIAEDPEVAKAVEILQAKGIL